VPELAVLRLEHPVAFVAVAGDEVQEGGTRAVGATCPATRARI
jgi:hypothetical protein